MADGDSSTLVWRKGSACVPSECVEVASCGPVVVIRDSSDQAGPMLRFPRAVWRQFLVACVASPPPWWVPTAV
ncbi:MAG: DUF397 domain-containing protein [Streptosporangiaceae bacterium]